MPSWATPYRLGPARATEHLGVSFLAPGWVGPIRATATAQRVGKQDGIADVRVIDTGKEDQLIGVATVTVLILDKNESEPLQWPGARELQSTRSPRCANAVPLRVGEFSPDPLYIAEPADLRILGPLTGTKGGAVTDGQVVHVEWRPFTPEDSFDSLRSLGSVTVKRLDGS